MKKKRRLILFMAIALPLLALLSDLQGREVKNNAITLNPLGEGTKEVELTLEGEGVLDEQEITLTLPEQKPSEEEAKEYFAKAKEEIASTFFAEGDSKEGVKGRVFPEESYCEGLVKASWRFGNYRLLDYEGERTGTEVGEDGEDLLVEAELSCGEEKEVYSFTIHLLPEEKSEAEKLLEATLITIKLQEETPGREKVELPTSENGVKLTWKEAFPHTGAKILLLELAVVILYPLAQKERQRQAWKNREKSLLLEYPNLVNKLSVLTGSGMSLKQSWNRISARDKDIGQKGAKELLEQMQFTARELESGASERQAYQDFAGRMQVQPYYRLSRILIQDLEKGGGGLKEQLQKESEEAFKERTLLARKLGEEAETKMTGPLILMMGIVMIIVIAPAIIEFTV